MKEDIITSIQDRIIIHKLGIAAHSDSIKLNLNDLNDLNLIDNNIKIIRGLENRISECNIILDKILKS